MEFKVFNDALLTQQSSVTSSSIELKYENYYDREDISNLLSFTAEPIEEEIEEEEPIEEIVEEEIEEEIEEPIEEEEPAVTPEIPTDLDDFEPDPEVQAEL